MPTVALLYPEVYDLARFREKRKEFPPFGVLYLAAAAEAVGYDVSLVAVRPGQPGLDLTRFEAVGFSLASSATYGTMLAARRSATFAEGALLLAGGVHANFYPASTLRDFAVDAVAENGDEQTWLDCLSRIGQSSRLIEVAGLWTLDSDSEPTRTSQPPRPVVRDISKLPLPARHLLPADDVVMTDRLAQTDVRMAHMMLSRGCPFPCRFCAAAKQAFQWRSGASARTELEHLQHEYDIGGFAVVDDNFIIRRDVVIDVCESIADLGLSWSALSRVDRVDDKLLAVMRTAGCVELKFGIESGSARMLKLMNKGGKASPEATRSAIRGAARAGIGVKAFVIHGFPGEDDESTNETMELLSELADDIDRVSLFRFVPLPGTYVFNHPEEFALRGYQASSNGSWERFHIHHNDEHWWGTDEDFAIVERSYARLRAFVDTTWPDRHQIGA